MRIWMLGSGSRGNAVLLECDDQRILIDCGFGTRTIAGRLRSIGVAPESIDTCLVTHEHSDHVKGVAAGASRWGWRVYATPGTAANASLGDAVTQLTPGATLELNRMSVASTGTPHDAAESVGFVVTSRSTGARAGIFYDIGHVSRPIAAACADLDLLVLESNHDDDMLRTGPYPRWLQGRIACDTGHLSNRAAGAFARDAVTASVRHVVLAHLSENCNTPDLALASMGDGLRRTAFRGTLTAAQQDAVVGPFAPGQYRPPAPMQYTLGI